MLNATAILLDEKRFGGKGKYRLSFQLLGIDTDDAHLFVSLYDVSLGKGSCTVTLIDCDVEAATAVWVAGNSEVTVRGGRFMATEQLFHVGE